MSRKEEKRNLDVGAPMLDALARRGGGGRQKACFRGVLIALGIRWIRAQLGSGFDVLASSASSQSDYMGRGTSRCRGGPTH